jgi:hypothetical protein
VFTDTDQVIVIDSEQIHVASVSGNNLTVADSTSHPAKYEAGETGRGYNNTTAATHADGSSVYGSVDIYNTYVSFTDLQPDELLGADLYTNSTQQGILQSNDEPPLCRDMALYQNHMFYANTTGKHSASFRLEGTSLTGISSAITNNPLAIDGDSIVVASRLVGLAANNNENLAPGGCAAVLELLVGSSVVVAEESPVHVIMHTLW